MEYLPQNEAVFQLHLLQQLGFEESDIQRILSNNYKLKQKFEEIYKSINYAPSTPSSLYYASLQPSVIEAFC